MTGASNQQTDLRKVFYQCRLGQVDLERMFAMACEGIPAPNVQLSTVIGNTRFWESELATLVSAAQASAPESNDKWSNISLEATSTSGEKVASISVDTDRTEFNFSGSDATWAHGQAARMEKFLVSRGAVASSPKYENKISLMFATFFVAFAAFWLSGDWGNQTAEECISQAKHAERNSVYGNITIAVLLTIGLSAVLFQVLRRRASRAQLRVDGPVANGSWWSRLSTAEKIAAAGVPIAFLATVGTAISAASDILGK
ncbi:hypothetical protein ACWDBF_28785 [Streptomyces angustmyceticus]